ncbi:MAG: GntR family transcriptional regulator [Firmicutes bacterium]|nr:GntR family transcriptional regulator [Bacillota bacterium]
MLAQVMAKSGQSTRLKSKPLTQMVYDRILGEIINGEITTNDIITEGRLVQELGVSKSPVREALITLCNENVLRSVPRAGYRVVQIMSREIEDLIETRRVLELALLERSFPLLTEEKITQLRLYLEEADELEMNRYLTVHERWQVNTNFHLLLASFAGNRWLSNLLEQTLRTSARASTQYFLHGDDRKLRTKEGNHPMLVAALTQRDFKAARECLLHDIADIMK